ncbi:unnamed protein product [Haemonchus placei]|uniref:Cystathionine beta-lyase n=1 Tax=Haemonchus placei TaxID=6290 RepID=A0A0N4X8A8_HAEPC|nr:unnamed protein product [Haemonchus placei]
MRLQKNANELFFAMVNQLGKLGGGNGLVPSGGTLSHTHGPGNEPRIGTYQG